MKIEDIPLGYNYIKYKTVYDDYVKKFDWNPKWIPFAGHIGGEFACIDLDPNKGDENNPGPADFYKCGEIFTYIPEEKHIVWRKPDFRSWLEDIIEYAEQFYD